MEVVRRSTIEGLSLQPGTEIYHHWGSAIKRYSHHLRSMLWQGYIGIKCNPTITFHGASGQGSGPVSQSLQNLCAFYLSSTNTQWQLRTTTLTSSNRKLLRGESVSKAPHDISQTHPTYIHLTMKLASHHCVLQVTITPFVLPDHPEQTFSFSLFRFAICCTQARSTETTALIVERVQQMYAIYYRPCLSQRDRTLFIATTQLPRPVSQQELSNLSSC